MNNQLRILFEQAFRGCGTTLASVYRTKRYRAALQAARSTRLAACSTILATVYAQKRDYTFSLLKPQINETSGRKRTSLHAQEVRRLFPGKSSAQLIALLTVLGDLLAEASTACIPKRLLRLIHKRQSLTSEEWQKLVYELYDGGFLIRSNRQKGQLSSSSLGYLFQKSDEARQCPTLFLPQYMRTQHPNCLGLALITGRFFELCGFDVLWVTPIVHQHDYTRVARTESLQRLAKTARKLRLPSKMLEWEVEKRRLDHFLRTHDPHPPHAAVAVLDWLKGYDAKESSENGHLLFDPYAEALASYSRLADNRVDRYQKRSSRRLIGAAHLNYFVDYLQKCHEVLAALIDRDQANLKQHAFVSCPHLSNGRACYAQLKNMIISMIIHRLDGVEYAKLPAKEKRILNRECRAILREIIGFGEAEKARFLRSRAFRVKIRKEVIRSFLRSFAVEIFNIEQKLARAQSLVHPAFEVTSFRFGSAVEVIRVLNQLSGAPNQGVTRELLTCACNQALLHNLVTDSVATKRSAERLRVLGRNLLAELFCRHPLMENMIQ